MVQVDGVEGESLVEVWRGGEVERCWWLVERAPLQKGAPLWVRARPCCLLGRQGLKPFQEVW